MPFPADRVGFSLKAHHTDVAIRSILAYAAGLGARDPAFLDDAREGGLLALPFQCVSLEWPVIVSLRQALEDVLSPDEARRGVHATQDSSFHRPIRPADRLVTEGALVSVRAVRAGVMSTCKLTTRDRDTGEAVVTSWSRSIYRDVALSGQDHTLEEPQPLDANDVAPLHDAAESVAILVPREMPHVYSECAAIWNPIHTERAVAQAAGLPDIILHGTATWALAGLTLLRRYGACDVARLERMTGRFAGMVIPGDTITIRHQRDVSGVVRFEVLTSSGAPAIRQGVAWLRS